VQRRIDRIAASLDPLPDRSFFAYSQALIEFGGEVPSAEATERLARYLSRHRRGQIQLGSSLAFSND
jgi:hypothetical protein